MKGIKDRGQTIQFLKLYTHYFSDMMMPNVSIFIAWAVIAFAVPVLHADQGFDQVRRSYFTFSLTNIACLHWRKNG